MRIFNVWVSPAHSDEGELFVKEYNGLVPLDVVAIKAIRETTSRKTLKIWGKELNRLMQEIQDRIEELSLEEKETKDFEKGFVEDMQDDSWETGEDSRE